MIRALPSRGGADKAADRGEVGVPERVQVEGADLQVLLDQVRTQHGPQASIISADKVRSGGVAGFFARESYRLTVELAEPEPAPVTIQTSAQLNDQQLFADHPTDVPLVDLAPHQREKAMEKILTRLDQKLRHVPVTPDSGLETNDHLGPPTPAKARTHLAATRAYAALGGPVADSPVLNPGRSVTVADSDSMATNMTTEQDAQAGTASPAPAALPHVSAAEQPAAGFAEVLARMTASGVGQPQQREFTPALAVPSPRVSGETAPAAIAALAPAPVSVEPPAALVPAIPPEWSQPVQPTAPAPAAPASRVGQTHQQPPAQAVPEPVEQLEQLPAPRQAPAPLPAAAESFNALPPKPFAPVDQGLQQIRAALAFPVPNQPKNLPPQLTPTVVPSSLAWWLTLTSQVHKVLAHFQAVALPSTTPGQRLGLPQQQHEAAASIPAVSGEDLLELARLIAAFPPAPLPPQTAEQVLIVVGQPQQATKAATQVASSLGLPPDNVIVSGSAQHPTPEPDWLIQQVQQAQQASGADQPAIIALEVPFTAAGARWAQRMLAACEPATVWAVADATRKLPDLHAHLAACGGVDALMVVNASSTADLGSILQLGIPVATLDGHRATRAVWTALLGASLFGEME